MLNHRLPSCCLHGRWSSHNISTSTHIARPRQPPMPIFHCIPRILVRLYHLRLYLNQERRPTPACGPWLYIPINRSGLLPCTTSMSFGNTKLKDASQRLLTYAYASSRSRCWDARMELKIVLSGLWICLQAAEGYARLLHRMYRERLKSFACETSRLRKGVNSC